MGKYKKSTNNKAVGKKQNKKSSLSTPTPLLSGGGVSKKKAVKKDDDKLLFSKQANNKNHRTQSKKEKQQTKRNTLMKKIDLVKKEKVEEIKRKKREKTVVTGDLKPLKDALPSLDELFKLKPGDIKTGIKDIDKKNVVKKIPRNKNDKSKLRKKEFMNRYNCFTSLLKDKDYRKNPRETIAYHIEVTNSNNNDLL